ncbi:MAG: 50S ribosomal protein L5 [Candidatus Bathyarchaeia archaeon]
MVELQVQKLEEDQNPMRRIRVGKVVVNMAIGKSGDPLERARKVLEGLVGQRPCSRDAKKTVKDFGIRKGEPIACMATLRGNRALEFLRRALAAIGNRIKASSFDERGNFAFGIKEHIEIPGTKYDPELGIFGLDVIVALERPGFRVKRRAYKRSGVGKSHEISKEEAISFAREGLGIEVVEG